jgi:S-adenosyl-L-methionine hydrolase (adenosine-forming)
MQPSSSPIKRPVLAFLTDFGSTDSYVSVMKGVALTITSDIHLVDITHDVPPQRIATGAWHLATCYRYFPPGTIYVCVVDPGVGSARHPVALHAGNWFFVGPDNGLFSYILAEQPIHEAVILTNPTYHLPRVSTTFHGRDVFSPVAAHIARGVPLSEFGPPIETTTLHHLNTTAPVRQRAEIAAHIIHIDHFGNLITTIPFSQVPDLFTSAAVRLTFPAQEIVVTERHLFFSDPSTKDTTHPFLYNGSSGYIAVAIQNGNAAQSLNVKYGDSVTLTLIEK